MRTSKGDIHRFYVFSLHFGRPRGLMVCVSPSFAAVLFVQLSLPSGLLRFRLERIRACSEAGGGSFTSSSQPAECRCRG